MYIKPATIARIISFALGIGAASLLNHFAGLESTVLISCGVLGASLVRGGNKA